MNKIKKYPEKYIVYINSVSFEFNLIEPGIFMMGSPEYEEGRGGYQSEEDIYDDEILHQVIIQKPFYMQTTLVTIEQWDAVNNIILNDFEEKYFYPISRVCWYTCQDFISILNTIDDGIYRLPTEAEWEYACRAGTETPFGIGDGYCIDNTHANFRIDDSKGKNTPVKSFAPNAWGLYDMHGNLWEWVQDSYKDYPIGTVLDQHSSDHKLYIDPTEQKVLRGGSHASGSTQCRSAARHYYPPNCRDRIFGFRLVKEVE